MRFKELEVKALDPVWVICPYPTVALGLEKTLEAAARTNGGGNFYPPEAPSSIIYCPNGEDVASEVKRLRTLAPDASLLVFGLRLDAKLAKTAIRAGARGFIHAGMEPRQIVRALSVAAEGEIVIPRELLESLLGKAEPQVDLDALTPRQREILELVAEGLTNAQIAKRVFLSESTVKQHLRAAYKLLGVKKRTEAARLLDRKDAYNGSSGGDSGDNGAATVTKGGITSGSHFRSA